MKRILPLILILLFTSLHKISLLGQISFLDNNDRLFHLLDRFDVLDRFPTNHSSIRYKDRILLLNQLLKKDNDSSSIIQDPGLLYIVHEIPESKIFSKYQSLNKYHKESRKTFLGVFYKTPYSFLEINEPNFYLKLDPVIQFGWGHDKNDKNIIFQNSRGLKIRGVIDSKIYFFSSILENQRRFYNYIEERIDQFNAIPGQGFYKPYKSGIISNLSGWDYLNAEAYIGFKASESINIQMGHGKNFIGDGYNSMLLNDYAFPYFYLKTSVTFWKMHYQSIFAELSANSSVDNPGNELLPKKYMVAHYLDIALTDRLNIGLFESVIFGRANQFEFQYLNPVILYRTVEQFLDSPDNVLMGLNIKWNFLDTYQFYSQLLIDELRTGEIFSSNGWWGNKFGYQVGLKYYDAFSVNNLDLQTEFNSARPYAYAHRTNDLSKDLVIANYSHFNQPLAHPLGANFNEWIFLAHYPLGKRMMASGRFIFSSFGRDSSDQNFGGNILKDYNTRISDYDIFTTQGIKTNVSLLSLRFSWSVFHNYYLDADFLYRTQKSDDPELDIRTSFFGLGFRANAFHQNLDY